LIDHGPDERMVTGFLACFSALECQEGRKNIRIRKWTKIRRKQSGKLSTLVCRTSDVRLLWGKNCLDSRLSCHKNTITPYGTLPYLRGGCRALQRWGPSMGPMRKLLPHYVAKSLHC